MKNLTPKIIKTRSTKSRLPGSRTNRRNKRTKSFLGESKRADLKANLNLNNRLKNEQRIVKKKKKKKKKNKKASEDTTTNEDPAERPAPKGEQQNSLVLANTRQSKRLRSRTANNRNQKKQKLSNSPNEGGSVTGNSANDVSFDDLFGSGDSDSDSASVTANSANKKSTENAVLGKNAKVASASVTGKSGAEMLLQLNKSQNEDSRHEDDYTNRVAKGDIQQLFKFRAEHEKKDDEEFHTGKSAKKKSTAVSRKNAKVAPASVTGKSANKKSTAVSGKKAKVAPASFTGKSAKKKSTNAKAASPEEKEVHAAFEDDFNHNENGNDSENSLDSIISEEDDYDPVSESELDLLENTKYEVVDDQKSYEEEDDDDDDDVENNLCTKCDHWYDASDDKKCSECILGATDQPFVDSMLMNRNILAQRKTYFQKQVEWTSQEETPHKGVEFTADGSSILPPRTYVIVVQDYAKILDPVQAQTQIGSSIMKSMVLKKNIEVAKYKASELMEMVAKHEKSFKPLEVVGTLHFGLVCLVSRIMSGGEKDVLETIHLYIENSQKSNMFDQMIFVALSRIIWKHMKAVNENEEEETSDLKKELLKRRIRDKNDTTLVVLMEDLIQCRPSWTSIYVDTIPFLPAEYAQYTKKGKVRRKVLGKEDDGKKKIWKSVPYAELWIHAVFGTGQTPKPKRSTRNSRNSSPLNSPLKNYPSHKLEKKDHTLLQNKRNQPKKNKRRIVTTQPRTPEKQTTTKNSERSPYKMILNLN